MTEQESSNERTPLGVELQEEGPIRRILTIQVPGPRVQEAMERAYRDLAGKAKVPGFRKGKVPRKVLEKNYGDQVRSDVVETLIERCCIEALQEKNIEPVASPQLLSKDFADGEALTFQIQVEVRPDFQLDSYKGLDVERRIVRVEDSHVEQALGSLRERYATLLTEEDRVNVAGGDVIVFDMDAFVDGLPMEDASGKGVQIEVGAGRFPEDFETGVVGVTRGIQTPIDVKFPEDHGDAKLAGQLVRFQVTVREIKNKILPALDDDLAREVNIDGVDSLYALRGKIRDCLLYTSPSPRDKRQSRMPSSA